MDISIDKTEIEVTNSINSSSKWRNWVLHHFNPPSQWQAHKTMESLGRASMAAQKDKGMQTEACMNGAQIHYSFVSLIISPPLMHPRGSTYSPSIGSEGSIQNFSMHMECQRSSYSWLIEENSKYFIFGQISQCMWVIVEKAACTHIL